MWRVCSIIILVCCMQLQADPPVESKPITKPTSQVFVGAGALLALQQDSNTTHPALSFSARGGYQYRFFPFFLPALIARIYLDYTMSMRPMGIESITTSHFLINSDAIVYCYTLGVVDFGLFGGFGLGYVTYGKEVQEDPNAQDSVLAKDFSAFVNGGISVLFSKVHRLEFGVKYPLTKLTLPTTPARLYQEIHLLMMYDYVF